MITRLLPLCGTGILIAIVALLGIKAAEVSKIKLAYPEAAPAQDAPTTQAQSAKIIQRPDVYYAAITERPVFDPSRRPYVPKVAATETAPKPAVETPKPVAQAVETPPPEVNFQGIITRDERTAALIGLNGEAPAWVAQGDPIAGWTLSDIGNDWIEISRDARSIRVDMYK